MASQISARVCVLCVHVCVVIKIRGVEEGDVEKVIWGTAREKERKWGKQQGGCVSDTSAH